MRSAMSSVGPPARDPDARAVLTGSHYDTVINAGKHDGRLGIVLPIVVAGKLRRDGVQLPGSTGDHCLRRRGGRALQVDFS